MHETPNVAQGKCPISEMKKNVGRDTHPIEMEMWDGWNENHQLEEVFQCRIFSQTDVACGSWIPSYAESQLSVLTAWVGLRRER